MAIDKKVFSEETINRWSIAFNIQPSIIQETIDIDYEDVTNQPTLIQEGQLRLIQECTTQCNGIELTPLRSNEDHQDIEPTPPPQ